MKNIKYNILALLSILLGIAFVIVFSKRFGASKSSDIYFISMLIVTYMGYFVQAIWEAFPPYYAECKKKGSQDYKILYSILLNNTMAMSFLIIVIYFLITHFFNILDSEYKKFLDIFIFSLLFQNILFYNKGILNLEQFYSIFYVVDIIINGILLVGIVVFDDLIMVAYLTLISMIVANIFQFIFILKAKINYSAVFYKPSLNLCEIYKNSIKLKLSSIIYGYKDIAIANIFTDTAGLYSLYSYANKIMGVILQIINAPALNIFGTKATFWVMSKSFNEINIAVKNLLRHTIVLYILSSLIAYFLIPFAINIIVKDAFRSEQISTIQNIFILLSLSGILILIMSPYGRIITALKRFNAIIVFSIIFALIVFLSEVLVERNYIYFMFGYIFAYLVFMLLHLIVWHKVYKVNS